MNKLIKLFWLILLVLSHQLNGQDSFHFYHSLIDESADNVLNQRVDSLIRAVKKEGDITTTAKIVHDFSIYLAKDEEIAGALVYGHMELELLREIGVTDTVYTKALYNVGLFYKDNTEFEKAAAYFDQVISLGNEHYTSNRAIGELAWCYFQIGDFYKAIAYYEQAFVRLEAKGDYLSLATHLLNISTLYYEIGTDESMSTRLRVLNKADSISNNVGLTAQNYRIMLTAFANQYLDPRYYDFEKARSYYMLNLEEELFNQDSSMIGLMYNNLAYLYNQELKDSAAYFIGQGLSYEPGQEQRALLFDTQSEYHYLKGDLKQALKSMHRALETDLGQRFDIDEAPSDYLLIDTPFKSHTLYCLNKKAEILIEFHTQTQNKDYLLQAIKNARAADHVIGLAQSESSEMESKLYWRKEASKVYLKGVYAAQLANSEKDAFFFTERNKALLLAEEISQNTTYANLPKNVSSKLAGMKKEILKLTYNQTPENQETLRNELFTKKRMYEYYLDSVKMAYPEYFRKYPDMEEVSLEASQAQLPDSTTLVSFMWNRFNGQERLMGMAISKNEVRLFEVGLSEAFTTRLLAFKKAIAVPLNTQEQLVQFRENSHRLYIDLFPAVIAAQLSKSKLLYIIPDGPLQTIPFGALITNKDTHDYLVQSHDISYLYSVAFLNHSKQLERKTSKSVLAYAPINFDSQALGSLPYSEKELEKINATTQSQLVTFREATKEHFIQNSSEYKVIHLATHASASDNPWIAFSNGKLPLHELYTYRNNAEMVILSGCNTNVGEMAEGEGVLSLARGFFYSGAKSVTASLWNVNDQSTGKIMADFYENLESGMSKAAALSAAKRNYLETHSLSDQSPYYWSSFVLMGDPSSFDFETNDSLYLYGLLVLVVGVLGVIVKKRKYLG